jgi:hypothetical protein
MQLPQILAFDLSFVNLISLNFLFFVHPPIRQAIRSVSTCGTLPKMADERWKQLDEDRKEMVNILNKHGLILELSDEVLS